MCSKNKMILGFLILLSFCLAKDARTDARIETTFGTLMKEFEQDLKTSAMQSAQLDYNDQYKTNSQIKSIQEIQQQYQVESDELFNTFKPIAHQIIENAAYNKNLNYYIWDEKTQVWHFYGRLPPNPPVDGSSENTKILKQELKVAWMNLLGSGSTSNFVASMAMAEF